MSGVFSNVPDYFLSLAANQVGTDVATAQPWFPGGGATQITLPASTSYFFKGLLAWSKTAGTTSRTIGNLFGGTATFTSIAYNAVAMAADSTAFTTIIGAQLSFVQVATNVDLWATPSTAANQVYFLMIDGLMRINGAGTVIPQFQFSAAPGGAPTVRANSWFRMWPIGSNTVLNAGPWS